VALAYLLFAEGDRHVTAETLHEEALACKVRVSLATVYNTLHQFTDAGLLREVAVQSAKTYFDTNASNHHHFFCEHSGKLLDIVTRFCTSLRTERIFSNKVCSSGLFHSALATGKSSKKTEAFLSEALK
jgi:Fe2+ or Zn2+ uptake regulation protein